MANAQDVSTTTALKFDSQVISRKHAIFSIIDKKVGEDSNAILLFCSYV